MAKKNRRFRTGKKKGRKHLQKAPQQSPDQSIFTFKRVVIAIILTMMGLLTYIVYGPPNSGPELTEATILYHYSDLIKRFLMIQDKIDKALKEEPVADLMKFSLGPIQDILISMRTQTSIYEKMERIPGGPTNFMSTTLRQLNSLKQKITFLDQEVWNIMANLKSRKTALIVSAVEVLRHQGYIGRLFNVDRDGMFFTLEAHGINLIIPQGGFSPSEAEIEAAPLNFTTFTNLINGTLTPSELADKLEFAGNLFEKKRLVYNEMTSVYKSQGHGDLTEQDMKNFALFEKLMKEGDELAHVVVEYFNVNGDIQDLVKTDGKHFNLTIPWIREANMVLGVMTRRLKNDIDKENERNEPYFKLRDTILRDIHLVEQRVKNLQYTYVNLPAWPLLKVKAEKKSSD